MQHSQLNTIYPISPFVYDYNRINETFNSKSQELDRNNFLLEVASVGVKHCEIEENSNENSNENSESDTEHNIENTELYRLKEMLGYLSEITLDQLNNNDLGAEYSEIRYFRTDQTINSSDPKYRLDRYGRLTKQLWINLHTLAYDCTKSSAIIDSDMKEIVSWCIVPIIGNVRPMSTDSIIYSDLIDNEIKTREKRELFLKENPHLANAKSQTNSEQQTIVDCSAGQQLVNTRLQRFAQRNFIKREIEKKEENVSDQVSARNGNSTAKLPMSQIVKPNKQQINFNSHTRANAQNIRSAIMSKYKQSRLRLVPQQKEVHRSIDLRIRNASEKVAKVHNDEVMSRVRFMDRTYSDYRLDDAIIAKTGSIWRFMPMTSGRIILDLSNPDYEIPAGESVYNRDLNRNSKVKKKQIEEKSRFDQIVNDNEPDYVGNAKKKEKRNTKISRIAKRDIGPKQKIIEDDFEENVRARPYWMARKVITKDEEEAAKLVVGDKIGPEIQKKSTKLKKKEKPRDRITSTKRSRDSIVTNDETNNETNNETNKSKRKVDIIKIPDLAFVTVVRLDKILCLTLNCLRIDNLVE